MADGGEKYSVTSGKALQKRVGVELYRWEIGIFFTPHADDVYVIRYATHNPIEGHLLR
ncbi:MAG: hypothetical protein LUF04_06350 [Bacteroides sp.]|nr:hypothetical protein [Bacteroides sp.]